MPTCSYPTYTQPYFDHHLKKQNQTQILYKRCCFLTTISSNSKRERKKSKNKIRNNDSKNLLLENMYSFLGSDTTSYNKGQTNQRLEQEEEREEKSKESSSSTNSRGLSTNMWWANLKAALGQCFNVEGIVSSATVVAKDRHLALPHLTVPDMRWVNWSELHRRGFKGVVFDKDNTLTAPYSLALWPPLESSLDLCKSVFGDNIAIFSNSAGLAQYDADGFKARAIEDSVGICVIKHGVKKPAGTAEDIEKHFGCASSLLVMVGDRHFTDIVYGNRNGFLTILTEPLSLAEEPFVVKQVLVP
ncbi:hypothetical protein HHK36_005241 [Tetracentron sinense]|uniref:Uncharacterized protein n=1 Tax=Tetracentron sinense TaxID=13715 RepID=A0A834ZMT4_TETSI|nr:hypothetical protein HHK36_005241 [Tetracentron sinense]